MSTKADQFIERKMQLEGRHLVSCLFSVIKISHIYDQSNKVYLKHLERIMYELKSFMRLEREASIESVEGGIVLNGVRLKPDFASWSSFRFVLDFLEFAGIGRLTFYAGLTPDELSDFLSISMRVDSTSRDPYSLLEDLLIKSNIRHIAIDRVQKEQWNDADNSEDDFTSKAKRRFYRAISYLKAVASQMSTTKTINAKKARNLVQSLVDDIIHNESFMLALTTIKNYDEYTLNHSVNVCILSLALGMKLGLERDQLSELGVAALFHDIGKIYVSGDIINKPGKLTKEEWEVIKRHPSKGAIILWRMRGLGSIPVRAMIVALQHHRTYDQKGYPDLSRTRDLDLFSRIVSIADVFDAATSPRPYKPFCLRRDEVLSVIASRSGTQFDPVLAKAFAEMLGYFPVGSLVLLNSGEVAIVWQASPGTASMLRPRVKVIADRAGNLIEPHVESLTTRTADQGRFERTIVKALDPDKYSIRIASYL